MFSIIIEHFQPLDTVVKINTMPETFFVKLFYFDIAGEQEKCCF